MLWILSNTMHAPNKEQIMPARLYTYKSQQNKKDFLPITMLRIIFLLQASIKYHLIFLLLPLFLLSLIAKAIRKQI